MIAISVNLWVLLLENLPSPQIVGEPVPSGQKRPGMNKILMVFGTFWGNLGYFGGYCIHLLDMDHRMTWWWSGRSLLNTHRIRCCRCSLCTLHYMSKREFIILSSVKITRITSTKRGLEVESRGQVSLPFLNREFSWSFDHCS